MFRRPQEVPSEGPRDLGSDGPGFEFHHDLYCRGSCRNLDHSGGSCRNLDQTGVLGDGSQIWVIYTRYHGLFLFVFKFCYIFAHMRHIILN